MTWHEFVKNQFMRFVLIFWFISSFFVLFLVGQLDRIVHGELYNFGLQFSLVWAQPYWINLRLIYVWLIAPSVLGAIALGFDFWKKSNNKKHVPERVSKLVGVKVQSSKGNSMLISCPSCKRTFSKPLVMLDFSSGKGKLVNVCPYCNAKLGDGGKKEDEDDVRVGILGQDEKVKTE